MNIRYTLTIYIYSQWWANLFTGFSSSRQQFVARTGVNDANEITSCDVWGRRSRVDVAVAWTRVWSRRWRWCRWPGWERCWRNRARQITTSAASRRGRSADTVVPRWCQSRRTPSSECRPHWRCWRWRTAPSTAGTPLHTHALTDTCRCSHPHSATPQCGLLFRYLDPIVN